MKNKTNVIAMRAAIRQKFSIPNADLELFIENTSEASAFQSTLSSQHIVLAQKYAKSNCSRGQRKQQNSTTTKKLA